MFIAHRLKSLRPLSAAVPFAFLLVLGCSTQDGDGGFDGERAPSLIEGENELQAGAMTAGLWDDNLNFEGFMAFVHASDEAPTDEAPADAEDEVITDAPSNTDAVPVFDDVEHEAAHDLFAGARPANSNADIAFVLDTTGSMSDELSYLVAELREISSDMAAQSGAGENRMSLIVFRDEGDDYVTKTVPFTSETTTIQQALDGESAAGGGDWPEASADALEEATALSWRADEQTARIVFWITDAPHHDNEAERMAGVVRDAAAQNVHLYPIAASGAGAVSERTMRKAAQLTGGRFIFITDDSGIGDAHAEPTIDCFHVTSLKAAMVRVLKMELVGTFLSPAESDIIRTVGKPVDGTCAEDDNDDNATR